MYGDKPPYEKGQIEIGGKAYEKETARLDDCLAKVIEANIKAKGRKITPEIALHHMTTINAVAKVKNGDASPYDIIGGQETCDSVDKVYPLEMTLCRNFKKLTKSPGNEDEINKMFNVVQGISEGMTTSQAMKEMKNRVGKVSNSFSW